MKPALQLGSAAAQIQGTAQEVSPALLNLYLHQPVEDHEPFPRPGADADKASLSVDQKSTAWVPRSAGLDAAPCLLGVKICTRCPARCLQALPTLSFRLRWLVLLLEGHYMRVWVYCLLAGTSSSQPQTTQLQSTTISSRSLRRPCQHNIHPALNRLVGRASGHHIWKDGVLSFRIACEDGPCFANHAPLTIFHELWASRSTKSDRIRLYSAASQLC